MKTYEEKCEIRTCDCDMLSSWKPSAIMRAMQDTASTHSSLLGAGIPEMNKQGIAWVLSRGRVEMKALPKCSDIVSIETYPLPTRHMFIPRVHVFRNQQGEELGHAYCLWVVLNIESRKIIHSTFVEERMPDNHDLSSPTGMPKTVQTLPVPGQTSKIVPMFTDCDFLGHVNNTRYLDWCCDALGYDILKDRYIADFDINFEHEIHLGETVETKLALRNGNFTFIGSSEARRCFSIGGSLRSRTK